MLTLQSRDVTGYTFLKQEHVKVRGKKYWQLAQTRNCEKLLNNREEKENIALMDKGEFLQKKEAWTIRQCSKHDQAGQGYGSVVDCLANIHQPWVYPWYLQINKHPSKS